MKYLFTILLISIVIVLFGCIFIYQGTYFPKEPDSTETVIFLVKQGEGAKEISINLKKQDLIKDSFLFRVYALAQGRAEKLQAGEYELSPGMAIPEIVNKLASGDRIKKMITIIEGWTNHAADSTQAHSDYFLNTGTDIAGGGAGFTWTFNASAGTDSVMTFGDGTINVTAGALQVSGSAVQTGTDLTDDSVQASELALDYEILLVMGRPAPWILPTVQLLFLTWEMTVEMTQPI